MLREIAEKTGVYSISVMAARIASICLLPVYTRYLGPADYGLLELLELTTSIIGTLLGCRLGQAVLYYYSSADTPQARDRYFATAFLGTCAVAVGVALLGTMNAARLSRVVFATPDYAFYFRLVICSMALSFPLEVGLSCIRAMNRPLQYVRISLSQLALSIALNLLFLVVLHLKAAAILWSAVLGGVAFTAYLSYYLLHGRRVDFDARSFAKMFRYSFPLGISGLGMFIIHFGDRFFLRRSVSLAELGVYALAYKIGMLVSFIQMPFDLFWSSQMFSIVRRTDGEKIYVRVCTYLAVVLVYVVVLLTAFGRPVVRLLGGQAFQEASQYIPWIAAAYVVRTISAHFRSIFFIEKKTAWEAQVTWVGALTCLAGYVILIPRFRLWGAVAATCAGFAAMFVVGLWKAQRLRAFPFEFWRLAHVTACALVSIGLYAAIRPHGLWAETGWGAIVALTYPCLLGLTGFVASDEWAKLRDVAKQVKSRGRAALCRRNGKAEDCAPVAP